MALFLFILSSFRSLVKFANVMELKTTDWGGLGPLEPPRLSALAAYLLGLCLATLEPSGEMFKKNKEGKKEGAKKKKP